MLKYLCEILRKEIPRNLVLYGKMNGVLVINKPAGITSRDVVNKFSMITGERKVGHTGTLDPIASGVLVLCVGKATKLVDVITCEDKQYVATVRLGIMTDTLDKDGKTLEKKACSTTKETLENALNSFVGEYEQEVPMYSAVRVNGKKLYEYARKNMKVTPPRRKVKIKQIKLLTFSGDEYSFKVTVSKGTYIRSLIRDINDKLNVIGIMVNLVRTRQGKFKIEDSYTLDEVSNQKYKMLSLKDVLKDKNCVIIDDNLYNVIKHGGIIDNVYEAGFVTFIYHDEVVAIYKTYYKDANKMKPFKMFL